MNSTARKVIGFTNLKEAKMSMIDSKGAGAGAKPVVRKRPKRPHGRADGLSLAAVLHDAIHDIQAGVEFWKTLDRNRHAKGGHSYEFLNRGG